MERPFDYPGSSQGDNAAHDRLADATAQVETTARDLLAEIERCSPSDLNRLPTGEVAALKGALAQLARVKAEG